MNGLVHSCHGFRIWADQWEMVELGRWGWLGGMSVLGRRVLSYSSHFLLLITFCLPWCELPTTSSLKSRLKPQAEQILPKVFCREEKSDSPRDTIDFFCLLWDGVCINQATSSPMDLLPNSVILTLRGMSFVSAFDFIFIAITSYFVEWW